MKILILGKNGQIGSRLVAQAKEKNITYCALARSDLDITDDIAVKNYFSLHHDFDAVINATGFTAVDLAEQHTKEADAINHLAVKSLAMLCKKYSLPFIHISTDYVFDGCKSVAYTENDTTHPLNVYGKTKLAGEKALQTIWYQHIILRVSWVFSEYGNNFVKNIYHKACEKNILHVTTTQSGNPTSASSVANVILEICKQQKKNPDADKKWGIYHYSNFPCTTWHKLASSIIDLSKSHTLVKTKEIKATNSTNNPSATKRPAYSSLNTEKIERNFSVKKTSWKEELQEILRNLAYPQKDL